MSYLELCEDLFERWIEGRLHLSAWAQSKLPNSGLNGEILGPLAFCPEPYQTFGRQSDRVAFLTANPGNGTWFQRREAVGDPKGPLRADSYRENAVRLAEVYAGRVRKITAVASSRVEAMIDVARRLQPDIAPVDVGFTQFELFPFHSRDLDKGSLHRLRQEVPDYGPALAAHLDSLEVVCAVAGACHPADRSAIVRAFAETLGFDLERIPLVVLSRRGDKPTVGVFRERRGKRIRAISCSCPYNVLPARALRAAFVDALVTPATPPS